MKNNLTIKFSRLFSNKINSKTPKATEKTPLLSIKIEGADKQAEKKSLTIEDVANNIFNNFANEDFLENQNNNNEPKKVAIIAPKPNFTTTYQKMKADAVELKKSRIKFKKEKIFLPLRLFGLCIAITLIGILSIIFFFGFILSKNIIGITIYSIIVSICCAIPITETTKSYKQSKEELHAIEKPIIESLAKIPQEIEANYQGFANDLNALNYISYILRVANAEYDLKGIPKELIAEIFTYVLGNHDNIPLDLRENLVTHLMDKPIDEYQSLNYLRQTHGFKVIPEGHFQNRLLAEINKLCEQSKEEEMVIAV